MLLAKLKRTRLPLFLPLLLIGTSSDCNQRLVKNQSVVSPNSAAGQNNPIIEFTYTPVYESFEDLRGAVLNVDPAKNKVLVFIKVDTLWRIKPDAEHQFITIRQDSSWRCDITTETYDHRATQIDAFLVPDSFSLPPFTENDSLPPYIYSRSLASMEIVRSDSSLYRIITFSGYQWRVKECTSMCGPGPNYFSSSARNVWLDPLGFLHLKISHDDTLWNCAEVILQQNLGYGHYGFHLGRINQFDDNAVLGLFTWDDAPEDNHREIDVELSRWSQSNYDNSQYVVQPYAENNNMHRFNLDFSKDIIHSFEWTSTAVNFESTNEQDSTLQFWTNQGQNIPAPGNENPRINLWLCNPDSAIIETETVIKNFDFYSL